MSEIRQAAFLNSQVACALIEVAGMQAENWQRHHRGESMAYSEMNFAAVIEKYGIHHNAALTTLSQP